MAKLKMLKLPKKPKQSASIAVLENYLKRVADVKKENAHRTALNKKRDSLAAKVAGIGRSSSIGSISTPKRRKKTTTTKKKTSKRKKKR
jgi:hypothetical protein